MTEQAAEPGIGRAAGGKIRIPFSLREQGVTADGMREIGPDDPRYADYDAWLTAVEADAAEAGDTWTVTGEVPDTGEQVSLTWRDGIDGWPADALHWALAAATEGLVQLDDGAALHAWLQTQGFTDSPVAAAAWREDLHPRDRRGRFGRTGGDLLERPAGPRRHPGGTTSQAVTPERYSAAFEAAFKGSPYSAFVTHYTPDEIRAGHMTPVLAEGGKAGVLIHDHGDGRVEPTALFNTSGNHGAGLALLRRAIAEHGANYCECYGPVLPRLYASLGFADDQVFPFDESLAAPDWDYKRFDNPEYHTMRLRQPARTAAAGQPDLEAIIEQAGTLAEPDWWATYGTEAVAAARVAFGIDPP